jgi:hypothetical protein
MQAMLKQYIVIGRICHNVEAQRHALVQSTYVYMMYMLINRGSIDIDGRGSYHKFLRS